MGGKSSSHLGFSRIFRIYSSRAPLPLPALSTAHSRQRGPSPPLLRTLPSSPSRAPSPLPRTRPHQGEQGGLRPRVPPSMKKAGSRTSAGHFVFVHQLFEVLEGLGGAPRWGRGALYASLRSRCMVLRTAERGAAAEDGPCGLPLVDPALLSLSAPPVQPCSLHLPG